MTLAGFDRAYFRLAYWAARDDWRHPHHPARDRVHARLDALKARVPYPERLEAAAVYEAWIDNHDCGPDCSG